MNNLSKRDQAQKDIESNKITPSEYYNILKSTWGNMTVKEKQQEKCLLRLYT